MQRGPALKHPGTFRGHLGGLRGGTIRAIRALRSLSGVMGLELPTWMGGDLELAPASWPQLGRDVGDLFYTPPLFFRA